MSQTTNNYSIALPGTAVIVSTWDEFHIEGRKWPTGIALPKYGGYVIEIDGDIKLATTDYMTEEIKKKLASLPPPTDEELQQLDQRLEEFERAGAEKKGNDGVFDNAGAVDAIGFTSGSLERRACSHPPCFFNALCLTYTDCHVCSGALSQNPPIRGTCI